MTECADVDIVLYYAPTVRRIRTAKMSQCIIWFSLIEAKGTVIWFHAKILIFHSIPGCILIWSTRQVPHVEMDLYIFRSTCCHPDVCFRFVLLCLSVSLLRLVYCYLCFGFFFFAIALFVYFLLTSFTFVSAQLVSFPSLLVFIGSNCLLSILNHTNAKYRIT